MRDPSPAGAAAPADTIGADQPFYSLWDLDSGNCLGTYDSEEEAVKLMRLLVEEYGEDYAELLDLSRVDEFGHREHVGSGMAFLSNPAQVPIRRRN